MRDTLYLLALLAVFGALGAISRYALSGWVAQWFGVGFAYGTLVVNLAGCFLLGLVAHLGLTTVMSETTRTVLGIGFLGAFTTFSTFGYETVRYLEDGARLLAFANVAANVLLGLVAVWAGLALARSVWGGS